MSIKIEPIIINDPNSICTISYNFIDSIQLPIPNWTYPDGTFVSNGTDSYIYTLPDTSSVPEFPGFIYGTNGTNGINYVSEVLEYETLIFESDKKLIDVCDILDMTDSVIGDTDFLKFQKHFRYSTNNKDWSSFIELNLENIKTIYGDPDLYIQFRYVAIPIDSNSFNNTIRIDKPSQNNTNSGWEKLHSGTSFFMFLDDYIYLGTTQYIVSIGNDYDFYIDTQTNKLYGPKNNGNWGSAISYTRTESTSGNIYIPSFLSDQIIESAIEGIGQPLNDIELTTGIDILFGTELSDNRYVPLKDDYIFLNPLFKSIVLTGQEDLKIVYTPRILPDTENYLKRLFLKDLVLTYNPYVDQRTTTFILDQNNRQIILKPEILLKAVSFSDYYIDCSTNMSQEELDQYLDIKFRYSSNQRQWTQWIPLTTDNIKGIVPDILSFFYIEFLFILKEYEDGNNSYIKIYDTILYGEYQNVSEDYKKMGKFGLRSDCNYADNSDNDPCLTEQSSVPIEWSINDPNSCVPSFNPYDYTNSIALYNKISNDISNIFGFEINYYRTDPDKNGRDVFLHEYQLYNIIDKKPIKVLFPENKYPDNTIQFNQFDLTLFESFEIHITREEFHNRFGIGSRPAKYDILEICQLNRVYDVEHTQSYKDFMGGSVYYKVVLKKHEDNKHIHNGDYNTDMRSLTKNNSIDQLFGTEVQEEFDKIANSALQENLTETLDPNYTLEDETERMGESLSDIIVEDIEFVPKISMKPITSVYKIYSESIDYDLLNGPNLISRNYYNLAKQSNSGIAISYETTDLVVQKNQNRSFSLWFNITEYKPNKIYNMINNYNDILSTGYKLNFIDGKIQIHWNSLFYDIDVSIKLNNWYGIIVNFDQVQHKLDMSLYRRKDISDPTYGIDSDLVQISTITYDLVPQLINTDTSLYVSGSDMLWTNMRIFNTVIPEDKKVLVLNQYIVKDIDKLILADNSTKFVISPNHKF